ncbi:PREDICTED: rhodanese-like domain-containing protein 6 [Tarenaya hassleriana]|uniref:rhodanese-like domain-containing protein 6 n=1 Tax=Tarenaya hassleriana TaxID=28532 RepID=UPI00053CA1E5|nr:PREDICTED: rhodanese-like domain-containing protein 6 [Tarenaya hassleriana]
MGAISGGDRENQRIEEEEPYGVLLYYKYTSIPALSELASFYESNCSSLGLLGRVRLSPHGVNVTVGGRLAALEEHIDALKLNPLFEGTDFKLASCHHPLNNKVAQECGFTSLSIRVVEELVTFSPCPLLKSPEISNAGKHLSAAEFHSVLQNAGKLLDGNSGDDNKELILLDARNLYETRIGKFETTNVDTFDPEIRQYSDLPSWIDRNTDKLKGKNVLMYCTGGIRCEMASAYIRSKGAGFENVFQLFGGIQRYLEQFPDGGFFKGKNFVFDHRISVGSSKFDIIGNCLLCGSSFDDYSPRCRCQFCRMLVLVCDSCRVKGDLYVCELCRKHGKGTHTFSLELSSQHSETNGSETRQKLRILCLHGFRQNASGFKGRSGSLIKKLKNIAELVFVDAPHELPFVYQTPENDAPSSDQNPISTLPPGTCKKKFAWLVSPDSEKTDGTSWRLAEGKFDPLQYQYQTDGFDESLAYLKKVSSEQGPFDGILGFSQGAAMAAAVCGQPDSLKGEMDFRFCVLCSGFAPLPLLEKKRRSIRCPSLHIFGSEPGKDRQIVTRVSADLAEFFEEGCATVIEHDSGHIIPTRAPYIDEIKAFLKRFI